MSAEAFAHECGDTIRQEMAGMGIEVTVSTLPPMVEGLYTVDPMTCPHGVTYWWEPTGEQIAQWVRDGTP